MVMVKSEWGDIYKYQYQISNTSIQYYLIQNGFIPTLPFKQNKCYGKSCLS